MFVLADDELFEFCVSCVKFGENRRVFVEFVGSVIFVDLKLSQNPLLPTTQVTIGFGFTSDWLRKLREIFSQSQSVAVQSKSKQS